MHLSRILSLGGVALSIIPIVLGVVAAATRIWLCIKLNINNRIYATYGLFHYSNMTGIVKFDYPASQGLIIAGIAAIAVGVAIALLLDIVIKNRWVHLFPQLFLYSGPTLIFIGLLLYAKRVFEDIGRGAQTLVLGYSIILAIVACLLGFLLAIYFAFVAGTRHSHHDHHQKQVFRGPLPMPVVITDHSERF